MSTLRVSTIQDTAGSNSSTPAAIANGIAKAWVNFNGTGVVAIRAQYNVSSITDNGVGVYTVNFTTALADANYCFQGGGYAAKVYVEDDVTVVRTTSALRINARESSSSAYVDVAQISVSIFR